MRKPSTKTVGHIKNINAYINKIGSFFGTDSPEYQNITNLLINKGLTTYENKKGFINVSNTKSNRMKHQSIRAIDKNKKSFARMKKRYYEEQKKLFPKPVIPDLSEINDITIPDITSSNTGGTGGSGGTNEPLDFDTWYKDWRNTWVQEEQYEVAKLADELGVEFDYMLWYQDYGYRDMIIEILYDEYVKGIESELEQPDNSYAYDSSDLRDGYNPDFGFED